jgi:hypothetical protein
MYRHALIGLMMLAATALASGGAAAADPTMHQVYLAAQNGRMSEAQAMMDQVLRDHPNSAKAHYVEADLMAKQGRIAEARSELARAEALAPGLPFVKPQSVQALVARVSGTNAVAGAVPRPVHAHRSPWGLLLLVVGMGVFILLAARFMMRRNAPATMGAPGYGPVGPMQPFGNGGTAPMSPMGGGMGSGILGGLATGAAVGAGMVAGEELMHHVLDGNPGSGGAVPLANADGFAPSQDDMGGQDFGIGDGSWDDGSSLGGDDWN